jgi:ComF family protein
VRFESLLDVLFPPVCVACDAVGSALRLRCRPGAQAAERTWVGGLGCFALGPYEGPLRRAVLALKTGRRDVATALGSMLAAAFAPEARSAFVVVPVPTTRRRRGVRGFDQATLLATEIRRAGGPAYVVALERRHGPAQHGRSRAERVGAVRRFVTTGASFPRSARVLLLDDVVTTGATLTDAQATLRAIGVEVAGALVVARTHEGRRDPNS